MVAVYVCLPVHLLAIHIAYIGYNCFKNVATAVLESGHIMCLLLIALVPKTSSLQ